MFEGVKAKLNKIWKAVIGVEDAGVGTQAYEGDAEWFYRKYAVEQTRRAKYGDFQEMEASYGLEVTAALDAYADIALRQDSPDEVTIRVKSKNKEIIKAIREINRSHKIPRRLWSWLRCLAKNGDFFMEPIFDDFGNLTRLKKLPEATIFIQGDDFGVPDKKYPYIQKDKSDQVVAKFKPWQMLHARLVRDEVEWYGHSVLDGIRPFFKKLLSMEDGLAINRITRNRRYLHKVDISGLTPALADERVKRYEKKYKRKFTIDPTTGDLKYEQYPLTEAHDFFMGVTKESGQASGVTILEENQVIDITDILYFRDKLLSSLKVPKQWLNIDPKQGAKASSQVQNTLFASAVRGLQLAMTDILYKLYDICLTRQGIDVNMPGNEYQIILPKQPTTDELVAARVQLILSTAARNYNELGVIDARFILEDILNLEQDKVDELLARIEKAAEEEEKKALEKAKAFAAQGAVANQGGGVDTKGDKEKGSDPGKAADNGGSAPVRVAPAKKKEDRDKTIATLLLDPVIKQYVEEIKSFIRLEKIHGNPTSGKRIKK